MQPLRPLFIWVLWLLIFPFPATAAQFTVTSTADQVDVVPGNGLCASATGLCTLRGAIQESNALVPAPVGGHTITLPAGIYTLTIPHNDSGPDDASGNLAIHNDLTITGAGAATTIIEGGPPPSPTDGVITVYSPGVLPIHSALNARISGVTIRLGNPRRQAGGGISNEATLDLIDVVVAGNRAGEIGGGIANVGTLTLTRSIVSGNEVQDGPGGGIHNERVPDVTVGVLTITNSEVSLNTAFVGGSIVASPGGGIANSGGDVTITSSTISGNHAFAGGGIANSGGVLTITNSTIRDNTGGGGIAAITNSTIISDEGPQGGGIHNRGGGVVTITNSTISANQAFAGGGIANSGSDLTITDSTISGNGGSLGGGIASSGGNVTITSSTISGNGGGIFTEGESNINMKNTIIAGNTAFDGRDCHVASPVNSLGHNLVGDGTLCTIVSAPGTGDQIGTTASPIIPRLGTLADNGGPTRTHALLAGSPAINAGDNVDCPPTDQRGVLRQDGTCDIGAFEFIPLVAMFATSAGQFSNLSAVPETILPTTGKPDGLTFPFGFFSWTVTGLGLGETITVSITYPDPIPSGARYVKVINGVWTEVTPLLGDNDGDNVLTLTITDGEVGDEDGVINGQISDPGGVGLASTSTVSFATFRPEVEIKLRPGVSNDTFEVEAFFTLGTLSNGINPLTEDVSFKVGSFSTPALSFKPKKEGFKFKGIVDGVRLAAKIRPSRKGGFKFEAVGKCADLDGTVNPVTVQLAIGDDVGNTETKAEIKSSRHGGKCGDRRDDDKDDKDGKHDKDDGDD